MKKNTLNKILNTVTVLFAECRFENVTIMQLAQAANINFAAISYYFGGKENLYQEVLRSQFLPALQALRETEADSSLTATEQLLAYVKIITTVQHKQPYLTVLWQYEMNRHATVQNRSVMEEYTAQLYQHIVSTLCYGISQKEFLPDLELYHTAFVLLEIIHAPYVPASLLSEPGLPGTDPRKNYTLQAVRHYLQGIRYIPL